MECRDCGKFREQKPRSFPQSDVARGGGLGDLLLLVISRVEYVVAYDWGPGKHSGTVPAGSGAAHLARQSADGGAPTYRGLRVVRMGPTELRVEPPPQVLPFPSFTGGLAVLVRRGSARLLVPVDPSS